MPQILLETEIHAPVSRCFDLARSIDFHVQTGIPTKEKAVSGKITGLIGLHEVVTFSAKHFGVNQQLTSKITEYEYPHYFTDEMLAGAFKSIKHVHSFTEKGNATYMKDDFRYQVPFSVIGQLFDKLLLYKHMQKFLLYRNCLIKNALESDEWKNYLINTV